MLLLRISMKIRNATLKDIAGIVSVHESAFKGFFLTELGSGFLKLYYSSYFKEKSAILLVAEREGEILGFASATAISAGFNTKLVKRNFLSYALRGAAIALTKPKALINLYKNWNHRDESIKDYGNYAELMSIAVSPKGQGAGIGKLLLMETENVVKQLGTKRISLTTDFYENEKIIGFYRSLTYKEMYEFTAYPNRRMYRFMKDLG